tara:strand:- start:1859 stop:2944 length:1086 start_codon:yes stop_codon:yes gene_type:complete
MKILYCIDTLKRGGKERQLVELIKNLTKNKSIECEIILLRGYIDYDEIYNQKIQLHQLSRTKGLSIKTFFEVYKIIKKFKPNIIHTWSWLSTFYIFVFKLLYKFIIINGSIRYAYKVKIFSLTWWLSKLLIPFSDYLISNSKAGLSAHKLIESSKCKTIYNGFDYNRIEKKKMNQIRVQLKLKKDDFIIGMVGRFEALKDYQTLILSAFDVLNINKNIHFLLIGDGINRLSIEKLANHNPNIHFLGQRNDIESIISELDIGILLNNINGHAEGLSNAIMEMMAFGKPVIATNAGGTPELIIDNYNGFLVKPFNQKQVSEKIISLINNNSLREKIGENAKKTISDKFSISNMVNSYCKVYGL